MEDNHVRRLPLQRSDKYLVDWMFLPSKLNVLSVNSFFLSSIIFIASAFPQLFLFLFGEKKKEPFKIYSPTDRQHQQVKTTGVSP